VAPKAYRNQILVKRTEGGLDLLGQLVSRHFQPVHLSLSQRVDGIPDRLAAVDAIDDGTNEYGTFLRTDGDIVGPNGRRLAVTAVWLRQHGRVRFLTLKPRREKKP
jgi:hypothetical protein